MSKQVKVNLEFKNKKGEEKKVYFYMDKETYEILQDETISEEERKRYLIEEYHEYERERYYHRHNILMEESTLETLREEREEKDYFELLRVISTLSKEEQEIVTRIYWKKETQAELCRRYQKKKQKMSDWVKKIHKKIKNNKKD